MTDVPPPPPPPPPSFGTPPPSSSPDVGAALSYGWNKFTQNWLMLILAVLIPGIISSVVNFIGQATGSLPGILLFSIIAIAVNSAVGILPFRVALQVTQGEQADIGKAFQYDRWGEWIIFSIVFGLMVGIGLVLCVIPGLLVLAFFGLAPYFFLDRQMSLGDSLNAAREAAGRGYAFPVLLAIIVGALGLIACGVGALVTAPIAYVATAFLFRGATNQPVAP